MGTRSRPPDVLLVGSLPFDEAADALRAGGELLGDARDRRARRRGRRSQDLDRVPRRAPSTRATRTSSCCARGGRRPAPARRQARRVGGVVSVRHPRRCRRAALRRPRLRPAGGRELRRVRAAAGGGRDPGGGAIAGVPAGHGERRVVLLRPAAGLAARARGLPRGDPPRDRGDRRRRARRRPAVPVRPRHGVRRPGRGGGQGHRALARRAARGAHRAPRRVPRRAVEGHPRRGAVRLPLVLRDVGRLADEGDARPGARACACPTRRPAARGAGSTTSTCRWCRRGRGVPRSARGSRRGRRRRLPRAGPPR